MYSWSAYQRRVPSFSVLRLVFMCAVLLMIAAMPVIQGPETWPAPLGVIAGLATVLAFTRIIRGAGEKSLWVLRGLAVALVVSGMLRGHIPDPTLIGLVGGLLALWVGMWWTLMSAPLQGAVVDGSERYTGG